MTEQPSHPNRRTFLASSAAGAAGIVVAPRIASAVQSATQPAQQPAGETANYPVITISSANGQRATQRAYERILEGMDVLDAVIEGVNIVEDDPDDITVGYGGLPNEDGVVQLDAAVMHGPTHQAGAVACLERIRHPSKVARLVLWQTDHVLLVGQGALEFAKAHGFEEENLLTSRARKIWLRWKQSMSDQDDWLPPPDAATGSDQTGQVERDDDERQIAAILRDRPTGTIHCSGLDRRGNMSCVTTTSGLAFKIPGRVGDSPIIGAGLYVDNEIGSCGSTGRGEANLQNQSCFAAVELMRQGLGPEQAGLEVMRRVIQHTVPRLRNKQGQPDFDLKLYLLRKDGQHAGVTMRGEHSYAVTDDNGTRLRPCKAALS